MKFIGIITVGFHYLTQVICMYKSFNDNNTDSPFMLEYGDMFPGKTEGNLGAGLASPLIEEITKTSSIS